MTKLLVAALIIVLLTPTAFAYTDQEIVELATNYWNRPAKVCLKNEETVFQVDNNRRLVKQELYTNCHLRETKWHAQRKIRGTWVSRNTLHIEQFIKNLYETL